MRPRQIPAISGTEMIRRMKANVEATRNMYAVLRMVRAVLDSPGLAGTDQNPKGINDLVDGAIAQAERDIPGLTRTKI